jgi:hypothetical protein
LSYRSLEGVPYCLWCSTISESTATQRFAKMGREFSREVPGMTSVLMNTTSFLGPHHIAS